MWFSSVTQKPPFPVSYSFITYLLNLHGPAFPQCWEWSGNVTLFLKIAFWQKSRQLTDHISGALLPLFHRDNRELMGVSEVLFPEQLVWIPATIHAFTIPGPEPAWEFCSNS